MTTLGLRDLGFLGASGGPLPWAQPLVLWLDANDASTVITNSNLVSQWNDKSGLRNNFIQNNGSYRPSYSATSLNNKPSINFDGSSSALNSPSGFLNGSSAFSIAMVMLGPAQINDAVFGPSGTNSLGIELVYTNEAGWPTLLRINGANRITAGLWSTNSVPTITTITASSTATEGWLNGSSVSGVSAAGNSALNYNGIYSIGQYSNGFFGQLNMSEFIISTSRWPQDVRERMEGYLAHKWGLTAGLPSNHPYKSTAPTI